MIDRKFEEISNNLDEAKNSGGKIHFSLFSYEADKRIQEGENKEQVLHSIQMKINSRKGLSEYVKKECLSRLLMI